MKKIFLIGCLLYVISVAQSAKAQSEEAQQLLLDVEKLAQLKAILKDLKDGYEIVSKGYNTIKDISEGNFNLHKDFLEKLIQVSPIVQHYKRITDIIAYQLKIVKEYKAAYNRFQKDRNFSAGEISYLASVYKQLFNDSVKNLEALTTVLTAGALRMSDDERLNAIDTIFNEVQEQLTFLRQFNISTTLLALQRAKEKQDMLTLQTIYGIN